MHCTSPHKTPQTLFTMFFFYLAFIGPNYRSIQAKLLGESEIERQEIRMKKIGGIDGFRELQGKKPILPLKTKSRKDAIVDNLVIL